FLAVHIVELPSSFHSALATLTRVNMSNPAHPPPLISIVLPSYNVEKYIERCIRSLQAQDDPDFEMVFVDDFGQDRSLEIVERYATSDPRIRIVRYGMNKGTFAARHEGAKAA